jgi:hypothetical protein
MNLHTSQHSVNTLPLFLEHCVYIVYTGVFIHFFTPTMSDDSSDTSPKRARPDELIIAPTTKRSRNDQSRASRAKRAKQVETARASFDAMAVTDPVKIEPLSAVEVVATVSLGTDTCAVPTLSVSQKYRLARTQKEESALLRAVLASAALRGEPLRKAADEYIVILNACRKLHAHPTYTLHSLSPATAALLDRM